MSGGVIFDEAMGAVGRVTVPTRTDFDGMLYDEAYGPRNPHALGRPIRVAEPPPRPKSADDGGPAVRDLEWLEVNCWCERTVKQVPAAVVRDGRTVRCRSVWCHPPYEYDWDEVTSPEGPVLVAVAPTCHAHGRPIGDAGCPDCVAEVAARHVIPEDRNLCLTHRWYTGDRCPRCGAPPEVFDHITSASELQAVVAERLARAAEVA